MTFPTIPTGGRIITGVQANTTTPRVSPNLNTLTSPAGELIIALCLGYQTSLTGAIFSGWTNGFTEFGDFGSNGSGPIGCAYKWSNGSETGTISVAVAGTITGHAAWIIMSIPGAHPTTPPEAGGHTIGTNTQVNPVALDPTGWGTEDTLWIAAALLGETALTGTFDAFSAAPTNYSGLAQSAHSGDVIGGVRAAVAFRGNAVASEDPGAFTGDASSSRWTGITIGVRPAPTVYNETGRLCSIAVTATVRHEQGVSTAPTYNDGEGTLDYAGVQTTAPVPAPSGPVADEGVVVKIIREYTGARSHPALSGWTEEAYDVVTQTDSVIVDMTVLTHPNPGAGPYTFTWTGGGTERQGISSRISGANAADFFGAVDTAISPSDSTTIPTTQITTTRDNALLYWGVGGYGGAASHTPPSGFTEQDDRANSSVATKTQATAGDSGTVSSTGGSADKKVAVLGEIKAQPGSVAGEVQHMQELGRTVTIAVTASVGVLVGTGDIAWQGIVGTAGPATANSAATGSFTPTAGRLLVAVAWADATSSANVSGISIADSLGGHWREVRRRSYVDDSLETALGIWWKPAGASPAAQTVTFTTTDVDPLGGWVVEVSGQDILDILGDVDIGTHGIADADPVNYLTLTTEKVNSLVLAALANWDALVGTAGTGATLIGEMDITTGATSGGVFVRQTALSGAAGSSVTPAINRSPVQERGRLAAWELQGGIVFIPGEFYIRPMDALTDEFTDGTLDAAKWTIINGDGITESGGVLHLNPPAVDAYQLVESAHRLLGTGSVSAKFVMFATSTNSRQGGMGLRWDDANNVDFGMFGTNLGVILTEGGISTGSHFAAYNATNHAWLQIRVDSTTIYFETSPTGAAGSWTTFKSFSLPSWPVRGSSARLFAGWFNGADPDPGEITVDNFNVSGGPQTYDETGRTVTIAATVTRTDIQAHKELDRTSSTTVTVTKTDVVHWQELLRLASAAVTVSAQEQQWPVIDVFTGTNGDPPDSALWEVTLTGGTPLVDIQSNKLRMHSVGGTAHAILKTLITDLGDQEWLGIVEAGTDNVWLWIVLRASGLADSPPDNAYLLECTSNGQWLYRRVANSATFLGGGGGSGMTNGERRWMRFQAFGTGATVTLRFRQWAVGSSEPSTWEIDIADTDAARILSGRPGMVIGDSGTYLIDEANIHKSQQPSPSGAINETGRTVTIAGTVTAVDVQHDIETRTVTAVGTVAVTDIQHHQELARTVTTTATVTATEALKLVETGRLVSVAATVSATAVQAHRELARTSTSTVTVTATDSISGVMNETNRLVSIAVTVSRTDVQAMKELDRAVNVTATVTTTATQAYKELERTVTAAATITAPTAQRASELGRLTSLAVTTSTVNVQTHKELARLSASTVTVTCTDSQFNQAQEFRTVTLAVTVTAQAFQHYVEDRTVSITTTVTSVQLFHGNEVARPVLVLGTVSVASVQHMAEARALTILVSVLATDFYRPLESLAPWHQPAGTITSARPNGSITNVGGGSTISDVIPDTTITDRRG